MTIMVVISILSQQMVILMVTLLLFSVFRRTAKKITFITAVLGSVDWPVSVDAAKVKVLGLHGVIHRPTSRRYQNHSKFWWVES